MSGCDKCHGEPDFIGCDLRFCPRKPLPLCPKCGAEDSMEHVKTEYHGIETHYDVCAVCDHRTDPE